MKRLCVAMLLASAVLASGADDKKNDAGKKELQKFEGTWTITSSVKRGKPDAADDLKEMRMIVKGNKFNYLARGKVVSELTLSVDPSKTPKAMDLALADGQKYLGIYEFDGDTLKICSSQGRRPTKFSTQKGDRNELTVFKRVKK